VINLDWKAVAMLGGVALVLYFVAKREAGAVAQAVNPLNPENVIYKGASSITPQKSIGSWLYDLTHEEYQP